MKVPDKVKVPFQAKGRYQISRRLVSKFCFLRASTHANFPLGIRF